jgi:hypothetical protein
MEIGEGADRLRFKTFLRYCFAEYYHPEIFQVFLLSEAGWNSTG